MYIEGYQLKYRQIRMDNQKAFYDKYKSLGSGNLGPQSGHSTIPSNCTSYVVSPTILIDVERILDRTLIDIVDFSGKKTNRKYNVPLFYIYKNGDIDRKLIIK